MHKQNYVKMQVTHAHTHSTTPDSNLKQQTGATVRTKSEREKDLN